MNSLFNLTPALRITLFFLSSISLGILLFSMLYDILGTKKRILIYYGLTLISSLLVMIITRTPLIRYENIIIAEILNYILIIPLIYSLILLIRFKKLRFIFDFIWCLLNLPIMFKIPYYSHFSCLLVVYILIRSILVLLETLDSTKKYPGRLSIKDALDNLDDGIIIANDFDKIIYINKAMQNYLSLLNISKYSSFKEIFLYVQENMISIGENTYLYSDDSLSLRFIFDLEKKNLALDDVTNEYKLINEERKIKEQLSKQNELLKQEIDITNKRQNENELLLLKANIHDNLAQQLSILHMFLLNNFSSDLRELKNILKSIDVINITNYYNLDDIINTYNLIGVNLHINGMMPDNNEINNLFYNIIREGVTNSVKHSFSKDVYIDIMDNEHEYRLIIFNDANIKKPIIFGNGLKGIKNKVEYYGGYLEIETTDGFKLVAYLPKKA